MRHVECSFGHMAFAVRHMKLTIVACGICAQALKHVQEAVHPSVAAEGASNQLIETCGANVRNAKISHSHTSSHSHIKAAREAVGCFPGYGLTCRTRACT